jgi:formiminotetrahydrofolate cyclodeaminase
MSAGAPSGRPRAFLEEPLSALIDDLAREGRVPGAGSVAAALLGMASAVVAMAARASRNTWREAGGAVAQAEALRRRALPLADADARALADAIALLQPVETAPETEPEASGERDFELGLALANAADVPLAIVQVAADVAALAHTVAENGSVEVRPDAVGAAVLADGAGRAAAHLVEINLSTTEDDFRVLAARSLAAAASSWAEQALALDS